MNCKDLMLGNWVYDGDRTKFPMYVVTIGYDYVYLNFDGNEGDVWESLDDDITPIPVTEELLEKIGFEKNAELGDFYTFWRYWDKERRYKLESRRGSDWCNSARKFALLVDDGSCSSIGAGEFTYVHELQNLVRIITGFSLPITKEMIYGDTNK